jgi:N-acetylmuramoyl-L-alanine amidase
MPRIYLSPSTQEYNITALGISEEALMNQIADAMMPYLQSSGIVTIRNTPQMTAASSITQSNQSNVDLHVALHSNAAPESLSGQLTGTDVYYAPASSESKRFADIVVKNLKKIYYQPDKVQARPTDFLGEVLRTRAPAVLIEFAYHDNLTDANWIANNIDEIARNVVLSITEFFGIPFVEAQPVQKGTVNITSGNLNIRSKPNTNSSIIGRIPKGATVNVLGKWNNWYVVYYNGVTGYASADFIKIQ